MSASLRLIPLALVIAPGLLQGQFQFHLDPVANPANGHYYVESDHLWPFAEARSIATACGGYVVAVNDAAEQQWLIQNFSPPFPPSMITQVWIGLTDEATEGTFLWDSGEPLTYTDWQSGEPDGSGDLVHQWFLNGVAAPWYNVGSGSTLRPLFEFPIPLHPRVTGLGATAALAGVTLTWQNPTVYDAIEVYRNGVLVATLPGTADTHLDSPSVAATYRYVVIGRTAGIASYPSVISVVSTTTIYALGFSEPPLLEGVETEVSVLLDAQQLATGWSFGVCFDETKLEATSVSLGDALDYAGFFAQDIYPNGITVGVVLSPGSNVVPAGVDQPIIDMTVHPLVPAPDQVLLSFCTTLGSPPVTVIIVQFGNSFSPIQYSSLLDIIGFDYLRGDSNGDGGLDVSDPIFLANHLFNGGAPPPCRAAGDANTDDALDIADVVFALEYLFGGGPTLAAPFPDCGPEPNPPGIPCDAQGLCP